jgi:hypothetical protein
MPKHLLPSPAELEQMDRTYRAGGLQAMASPHIHYRDPNCPHAGCGHRMEWIDFQLELYGDPTGIYNPLVRAWWDGTGFAGRCPGCSGWIRFTTLKMNAITEDQVNQLPRLPDNWHTVAAFA